MNKAKLALLFVCKAIGLFAIVRRCTRRRLRILCYHGFELVDETAFRPKLFIDAATFEQRLATIDKLGFEVLPLHDAVERLRAGRLPDNAVVITIDDGFDSCRAIAMPRLARHGFPATLYVTSYYVEHQNPIFRLAVQYMFWKTRLRRLDLAAIVGGDVHEVDLENAAARERATWTLIDIGEREHDETGRCAIARKLGDALAVPYEDLVRSRILTLLRGADLATLEEAGISIELHTHRHRFPAEDRSAAEREIAENRAALARWLSGEKTHFCYPSGVWDAREWPWLEQMGIRSATTCVAGLNDSATPRYALRRFLDGSNVHQLEFEAALSGFDTLAHGLVDTCRRWLGGSTARPEPATGV